MSMSMSMSMASSSLQSSSFPPHHLNHHPNPSFPTSSIFFKPSNSKRYSNLSTSFTAPSTSPSPPSLHTLASLLASGDFRKADDETRSLLIALAGEPARKRGYVFFSEVQFISVDDLRGIDQLWRQHSGERFGYSVQRRIWDKSGRDFTRFFIKVGWMKKLDTEVEQYNYRAFPNEFVWELSEETPQGHLPLTNALRGTQLLASILSHPAFQQDGGCSDSESDVDDEEKGKDKGRLNTVFKPDYSF